MRIGFNCFLEALSEGGVWLEDEVRVRSEIGDLYRLQTEGLVDGMADKQTDPESN